MIEHGLIDPGDHKSNERELEDLKTKTEGTDVLRFILSLPDPPETVDAEDPTEAKRSFLGRARQFIGVHRRSGLGTFGSKGQGGTKDDWDKEVPSATFLANKLLAH